VNIGNADNHEVRHDWAVGVDGDAQKTAAE
jgi:hypothetical protein